MRRDLSTPPSFLEVDPFYQDNARLHIPLLPHKLIWFTSLTVGDDSSNILLPLRSY